MTDVHINKLPLKVNLDELSFLVRRRLEIGGAEITRHPGRFSIIVNDARVYMIDAAKVHFYILASDGRRFSFATKHEELILPVYLAEKIKDAGHANHPDFRDYVRKYLMY